MSHFTEHKQVKHSFQKIIIIICNSAIEPNPDLNHIITISWSVNFSLLFPQAFMLQGQGYLLFHEERLVQIPAPRLEIKRMTNALKLVDYSLLTRGI